MTGLHDEVRAVLAADSCSGCGLCAAMDPTITMGLDDRGYLRPHLGEGGGGSGAGPDAAALFRTACPARRVVARRPQGSTRHPLLGPYVQMWEAWAGDDEMRHRGSSGGVLTALNAWLVEQGIASEVLSVALEPGAPTRTVPVTIMSRAEALASAGSRYAPVGAVTTTTFSAQTAVTAKPCEISAVRSLTGGREDGGPILLSFFCAGTPSQHATDRLVRDLGGPDPDQVEDLWYRGRGWPGRFTAVFAGGSVSADYDESWGSALGPTTQWRCKICPDGVGESADISAADSWVADERGYPVFAEREGVSALIARTERGQALILAAVEAGVLEVRPLDPEHLVRAQPLQVERRRSLAARLLGARLAGRAVPAYRGFGLVRFAVERPRHAIRTLRGAYRRVRAARR